MTKNVSSTNVANSTQSIIGQKFGRLTVLSIETSFVRPNGKKDRIVSAVCECNTIKNYTFNKLKKGHTKSCGCLHKEIQKTITVTHGMTGTKLYSVYSGILKRCNDTNDMDYGGRGIKSEFESFEDFYNTMNPTFKEGLTIDRINVDGNYSKNNCRWATAQEQATNRRSNIFVGNVCLKDYCSQNNLSYKAVHHRINRGMSIESALAKPFRKSPTTKK